MTNLTKPCKNLFCGFVLAVAVLGSFAARADDKMKMNFKDEDISKVLENYAKASGQKFVIDPSVHGKITILNNEPVAIDEAFNQLSIALALNQFCLIKEGDTSS